MARSSSVISLITLLFDFLTKLNFFDKIELKHCQTFFHRPKLVKRQILMYCLNVFAMFNNAQTM